MNMADQSSGNFQAVEADVADILGGVFGSATPDVINDGGTRGEADSSSAGDATPQAGAGDGVVAPSPSPDNSQQAPTEAAPQLATAQPAPAAAPSETAPAAPQPAAAQPQPNEAALREASLQAQIEQLNQQINQLRSQPAQPQAGQPAQPATQPESGEAIKRYNLTLPQQLREGLLSDNAETNIAAIQQMVNDLGTIVHNQVLTEVKALLQNFQSQSQERETLQTQETQIERARQEYYEQFPAHNNPLILPIIQAEAGKLAVEFPGVTWNKEFSATLGARVNGVLQQLNGGGTPPQPAAPAAPTAPAPAPRPAAMMPTGNRGGSAPGSEPEGSELIMDTLGIS